MLPHKTYSPGDIAAIVWRKRAFLIIPLALGIASIPMLAAFVPERYQSETVIMVIPQRVPDTYVKATVTERMEDRLPTISAQILSRSRLERVIREFGLYPQMVAAAPMEDVVEQMRTDIKGPEIEGTERVSFRLGYTSDDAATAQQVTARLASLYLEQNHRDRTNRADSTSQFLEEKLADAERRLIEHERKREEYNRRYAGQLPSQLTGNFQVIQNTQQQLQNIGDAINKARDRRLLYEQQLADAQMPLPVAAVPASPENQSAAQRLDTARADLDSARRKYKDGHPSIAGLERTVRQWEEKAAEEARLNADESTRLRRGPSVAEVERQRRISQLQTELKIIDGQIATSQAEEKRLEGMLATYQSNVAALPSRESELVELDRGYEVLKATHASLLLKREDSKIAADLERGQIGEQFNVIDKASFPERPHNQMRRLQLMAAAPLGGLLLGMLFVGLVELRDSTFRTEQEVERALKLPVLALVPVIVTDAQRKTEARRRIALDATTATVLLGAMAVVVTWRVGGW